MVAVLDTNHFTEFVRGAQLGGNLRQRIAALNADVFVSIVTAQESFEGWFALINRNRLAGIRSRAMPNSNSAWRR